MKRATPITALAGLVAAAFMLAPPAPAQMVDQAVPTGRTSASVGRTRAVVEPGQLPGKHNLVEVVARHPKAGCAKTEECGEIFYSSKSYNLVTNAGLNWLADIMSNTSTPSVNAQCNYIGLTNTGITPGASDTTLSGEIAVNGLSRAQATYAHTSNATTYTLAKTFTASGAQSAQAGAVFTASSSGTMCFEDTFTSASLQTNDTLTVTWTITI